MEWSVEQVVQTTGGRLIQGSASATIEKFTTDSRNVEQGSFFVPLKGPRFEGHDFIETARKNGAIGYFRSSRYKVPVAGICIEVEDPLSALQKLAAETRRRFQGPVVVITGSNGKTTTKEMIYSILKDRLPLLKTEGNLNNHIGLPLTLLNLKKEHRLILLEIGINHSGELRDLCEIAKPNVGLITSIGETHLEGLGNIEGVAEAKGELLDFLEEGKAILNRDSPFFQSFSLRQRGASISFGLSVDADVRGTDLTYHEGGISFLLHYRKKEYPVHLSVPGSHNVSNALGAAAVAFSLGISPEVTVQGLGRFLPVRLRTEVIFLKDGTKVIADAYNANPTSMRAALLMLADMGKKEQRKTIAVLGDMLELGQVSAEAHYQLGKLAAELKIDRLFLYGVESEAAYRGAIEAGFPREFVRMFLSHDVLSEEIMHNLMIKPIVLIKGSRGTKMEKVLDQLKKD
jgi:UDP-N-acetylmuramoyl-tripeptide--D-alanyl-D-alanine ligase